MLESNLGRGIKKSEKQREEENWVGKDIERGIGDEVKIRCGERKKRWPEGQENEWKSEDVMSGDMEGISKMSLRAFTRC